MSGADLFDALMALEERRAAAMGNLDVGALADVLDDDMLFVHTTGRTETKAQMLAALGAGTRRFYEFEPHMATGWGDIARLAGATRIEVAPPDGSRRAMHVFMTRIARRQGGVWRFVSIHASPLA